MEITWNGLHVSATISSGIEGDSDVPRGTRLLVEVESITVTSPDGHDISDYFTESALDDMADCAIEAWRDRR